MSTINVKELIAAGRALRQAPAIEGMTLAISIELLKDSAARRTQDAAKAAMERREDYLNMRASLKAARIADGYRF